MLAVLGPLGVPELIIILFIVIVIFGVGRLPEVGGAIGKSIREFRKASKEPEELPSEAHSEAEPPAAPQDSARACSTCSATLAADAKFCAECGTPTQATVQ